MEPGTKGHSKYAIRDCIRKYDPSISPHTDKSNFKQTKNFQSIDRNVLLKTVEYLGGSDMTDYTKPACINEVITKIDHHLPHSCQMCSDEFEIEQGVTSLLDCDRCGRGIHQKCLLRHINHPAADDNSAEVKQADIAKQINPLSLPGWRYLCKACDTLVIPSKETGKYKRIKNDKQVSFQTDQPVASVSESGETSQNPPTNEVDVSIADTDPREIDISELDLPPVLYRYDQDPPRQSETRNNQAKPVNVSQTDNDNNEPPKDMPICRFYLKNICKHGMSGKGITGTQCKYAHPKRCPKFTANGTHQGGCNKGKQCKYFHPPMCRNSLRSRRCTNENCRFVHIKGTKRYDPTLMKPTAAYNDYDKQLNDNSQTYQSGNNVHENVTTRDHFLGVLKDLKHELFQMMDQRLAHHPSKQQLFIPPQINPVYQQNPRQLLNPCAVTHQHPQMTYQQNQTY
jgi:hypothetical protein